MRCSDSAAEPAEVLGTTVDAIPAQVPYLVANTKLVDSWHKLLKPVEGFKVGIAWQGKPSYEADRERSIPLAEFAPLATLPVRLVSLQKGTGSEQSLAVADRLKVLSWGEHLDGASGAFRDTAAIMRNLDLVITSDTSIAHLAGALGVPVWVALPRGPIGGGWTIATTALGIPPCGCFVKRNAATGGKYSSYRGRAVPTAGVATGDSNRSGRRCGRRLSRAQQPCQL